MVARTAGGREVAGSNPVAPIFLLNRKVLFSQRKFACGKLRAARSSVAAFFGTYFANNNYNSIKQLTTVAYCYILLYKKRKRTLLLKEIEVMKICILL